MPPKQRQTSNSDSAPNDDTPITEINVRQLRAALGLDDIKVELAKLRSEYVELKTEITDFKASIPEDVRSLSTEIQNMKQELVDIKSAANVTQRAQVGAVVESRLPPDDGRAKFRIRITGIGEPEIGLTIPEKIRKDRDIITEILTNIDCGSIQVCDVHRRGKRNTNSENTRARPLIVEFATTFDKHSVLAKSKDVKNSHKDVYINSDLTPAQREVEKALLTKRHALINDENIDRKRLKIRSLKLYLDNTEVTDLGN